MVTLTKGNSYCIASGLTSVQLKQLKKIMSYQASSQASYFSGAWNNTRYLIDNKGSFPTGLLYLFKEWARKTLTRFETIDNRVRPTQPCKFEMKLPYSPYPEQLEAANTAYNADRGIIVAPTGVGKSAIIALLINKLQVRTLVVVPNLSLKRQLTETLTKAFGNQAVGGYGHAIAVENVDALDTDDLGGCYDAVIIDEFHHAAAATYKKLNRKAWVGVYHRYGLTATPFRSQSEEKLLLASILSRIVYNIDYTTAVEKGYIVPIELYYYDLPKQKVEGYTWSEVYGELVVHNQYRNSVILSAIDALDTANVPSLTLVKEIEHGYNIGHYPFMQGVNESNAEILAGMESGETPTVIGTTGVVGEGVDTKAAEYIIIAGLGKSKNAFMQQCGRGVRKFKGKESCKVIIFRDRSHKWTLAHFREQCKIAKEEYGIIPIKLELP